MLEKEYEFDYNDLNELKLERKKNSGNPIANKLAILKNIEAMKKHKESTEVHSRRMFYLTVIIGALTLVNVGILILRFIN